MKQTDGVLTLWFSKVGFSLETATVLNSIVLFCAILLAAALLAFIVQYLLSVWAHRVAQRTKTDLDDKVLSLTFRPLKQLIILGGVALALPQLSLPELLVNLLQGILFVLTTSIALFLVYKIGYALIDRYSRSLAKKNTHALRGEFMPLVRKLWAIFVIIAGVIIVLRHFHYDIVSLLAALGVGSLAVGLAAKDTLANMISGFTIMVDRPIRPGDRIIMNDGAMGDVVDIGMRSTKIRKFDHTILIVPNNDLVNARIINQTYPDPRMIVRIKIGVGYGSDVAQVKKCLLEEAQRVPTCLKEPMPSVYFIEFADSALIFLTTFWVGSWTEHFSAIDLFNSSIKKRFEQENIEIPFPMRTVLLRRNDHEKNV